MWHCPRLTVCPGFCIWVTRKNWPFSFLFFLSGSPLQRVCPQRPLHHRVRIGHSHVLHADGLCWCPADGEWPRSCPGPLRVAIPALPPLNSWSPVCTCSLLLIREPWVLSVQTAQRSLESPCDAPRRGWFSIFAAMTFLQTSAEFRVYDRVPHPEHLEYVPELKSCRAGHPLGPSEQGLSLLFSFLCNKRSLELLEDDCSDWKTAVLCFWNWLINPEVMVQWPSSGVMVRVFEKKLTVCSHGSGKARAGVVFLLINISKHTLHKSWWLFVVSAWMDHNLEFKTLFWNLWVLLW